MVYSSKARDADEGIKHTPEDKSFFEVYLEHRARCRKEFGVEFIPMSYSSFYMRKPYEVRSDQRIKSCVCLYHRQAALYVKALNQCRRQLHVSAKRKLQHGKECQHAETCWCDCAVCVPGWEVTNYLTPFMNSVLCPRENCSRHFNLACVLGKCANCSWQKTQGACAMDESRHDQMVNVRLLKAVEKDTPNGTVKKVKVECTERKQYHKFMADMEQELHRFAEHDYVARWQSDMYHRSIRELKQGEEVWIADYIENFSTFSKVELQQDYFNKDQIAIFVVMKIRWRQKNERNVPQEVSYDLPAHLCCEVHTFISGDRKHDDGLACLAFEKMAEKAEKEGVLPTRVIFWSDGAPNQFKFTRPVWWLSKFQDRFEFQKVPVWFFFQSCHGKGMQDAAGAWIKSRVSRAVLLGAEIRSVRDFFAFCERFLCTEAFNSATGSNQKFTAYRKFWLLGSRELAEYRYTLPKLATWKGIRAEGFFAFWPVGDEVGHVARRWLACVCDECRDGNHGECEYAALHLVDGKNHNEVEIKKLDAHLHADITQAEDIERSRQVRQYNCVMLSLYLW